MDENLCMDGSNFIQKGAVFAGAVVLTGQKAVIWSQAFPRGTSTQRAEKIALIQSLRRDERKNVDIYADN